MSIQLIGFESDVIHTTVAVLLDDGSIQYFKQSEIAFHLAIHAIHYGTAVLEGMQECNGHVLFMQEHWERICVSARTIGVMEEKDQSLTLNNFRCAITELYRRNRAQLAPGMSMYFRPLIVEGSCLLGVGSRSKWACIVITRDKTPYLGEAAKTGVTIWAPGPKHLRRADRTNGLPHVKAIINYALGYHWKNRGNEHGAVEVIQYDARGKHIAETTGSNLFVIEGDVIYTPPLGAILDGITRRRIIAILRALGYTVIDTKPISRRCLNRADGVLLTGTWSGVVPVRQIKVGYPQVSEGILYPSCPHSIAQLAQQHYQWLLERDPRCVLALDPGWHTPTQP